MKLFNKVSFIFIIISAVIFSGWIFFHDYEFVQKEKIVLAEDEEDEENEEDEEDEDHEDEEDEKEVKKTEYKTEYVKLSDTVSTKTTTIIKYDSDGDGILDEQDAHPTINENFVVKDDNLNGIDDRYEQ